MSSFADYTIRLVWYRFQLVILCLDLFDSLLDWGWATFSWRNVKIFGSGWSKLAICFLLIHNNHRVFAWNISLSLSSHNWSRSWCPLEHRDCSFLLLDLGPSILKIPSSFSQILFHFGNTFVIHVSLLVKIDLAISNGLLSD